MLRALRVAGALLALLGAPTGASGHSWYTGLTNGQGAQCCGGSDCAPLAPSFIRQGPDGLEVWHGGRWYSVQDWALLHIASPDSKVHLCFWGGEPKCLILPGGL